MVWLRKIKKYEHTLLLPGLIIIAGAIIFFCLFEKEGRAVQAGNCVFKTETAVSAFQQYQGLSDRKKIAPGQGMLFLFKDAADRVFVMRRMHFPLDIIFIRNHRVINLYHNLPPEGKKPTISYHSGGSADAVLEIPAGQAYACRLGVGSEISW